MRCNHCGIENDDTSKNCRFCGRKLIKPKETKEIREEKDYEVILEEPAAHPDELV